MTSLNEPGRLRRFRLFNDTALHTSMPEVAKLLPPPRRFATTGIQRHGSHGLSYAFIMEELQ
ncbi:MAG: hypothetical protein ABI416_04625 [Ginsengibacter sp.]